MPSKKDTIELIITKRVGVEYQGQVYSISSVNQVGPFDVLPQHANFVTPVEQHLEIQEASGQTKTIKIETGILRASSNRVEVYLDL